MSKISFFLNGQGLGLNAKRTLKNAKAERSSCCDSFTR